VESLQERLGRNLAEIRERIARAAERSGRAAEAVRLVAVTKTVGLEEIRALLALGVRDLGENRPELAQSKIAAIGPEGGACWHMIGSVQRRKARDVAALFDTVDSVDRLELAETLDARCGELGRRLPILIEVNVSGENSKHGFAPDSVDEALARLRRLAHLDVRGLMTMAPFEEDAELVRPVFGALRQIAARHGLPELSMGMSNDYEVAVEEGATQVRIGTALFI